MNKSERSEISILRKKRYSLRDIAKALGRSVSTISDELSRNKVHGRYDPQKAHHKAYVHRKYAKQEGMKIAQHAELRAFVERDLFADQSPTGIAGRLKKHERALPSVSKNTIYRYIESPYGRKIEHHRNKRKGRRHRGRPRSKPWADRVFIDQRPAYINARRRVGHAEGDFIVSGKSGRGILLVVVDRKLRAAFLEQILQPSQAAVTRACRRIKQHYPEWKTMTTDNDVLFRHHTLLEKALGIRIFFCFPYHSWEKGSVENTNKVIRRDVPKGSDISRYSKRFFRSLEDKLNHRYMAVLNHRTPEEMLRECRKQKKRRSAKRTSKK